MKNLYPAMFAIAVDKAAMIFDMVEFASDGGCRIWNLRFCCAFQDWDIGIFDDFFAHISSKLPREDDDTMIWKLNHSGVFNVRSFYFSLAAPLVSFPWKSIWCVKVPKMVAFFLWTAARGGILTIDNLVKKNLPLVNWCCLCRGEKEIVDHLLIHCKYANTLWSEVLRLFGVQWVMPKNIVSLLSVWWNWLESHTSNVWNMVLVCLVWLIWKEHNARIFKETERLVNYVKSLLLRILFEWSRIWGVYALSFFV